MQQNPLFFSLMEQTSALEFIPEQTAQALGGLTILDRIAREPQLNGDSDEDQKTGFTETKPEHQTQNRNGTTATDTTADLVPES
jgi:hypothetical protein